MSVVVSVNVNASLYKVICALLLLIVAFPCWQCVLHVNNNNNECICKVQNKWFSDALHHHAGFRWLGFFVLSLGCIVIFVLLYTEWANKNRTLCFSLFNKNWLMPCVK